MKADIQTLVANIRVKTGERKPDRWLERLAEAIVRGCSIPAKAIEELKKDIMHFRPTMARLSKRKFMEYYNYQRREGADATTLKYGGVIVGCYQEPERP